MPPLPEEPQRVAPDSFVVSHCQRCAAGWTRRGQGGAMMTVCLLDRELAWVGMTSCDRYEPRTDQE